MLAKTEKTATPLKRKAVLCVFSVSVWTARRLDRKVTSETNERYHADASAGRYNKLIIEAERLQKLTKLGGDGRAVIYKYTKPWADEGPRVLPNINYEKMSNELRLIIREFDIEADRFSREYPDYVEESKKRLNGMWRAEDYPLVDAIRSRFKMQVKYLPFPDAEDFRADIDDETFADLKREIEASSSAQAVLKDTTEQVLEVVGHMAKKLKSFRRKEDCSPGEKRDFFADSLVGNVRDLADLLPSFNLTDDPHLAKITERIKSELCIEEAETLRDNKNVRASVAQSADEIVAEVQKFFG